MVHGISEELQKKRNPLKISFDYSSLEYVIYGQIWLYLHVDDHHFLNLFLWMLAT
jgi:hypothetical protein